jgi:hypothetical protein
MSRTVLLAAATCLTLGLAASSAHAQRVSTVNGGKLLSLCTGKSVVPCDAYISGVADAVAATGSMAGDTKSLGICVPKATTGAQMREAVVKSLRANPDDNSRSAVELVLRALQASYGCS